MKREDLQALGLTDEQIEKIMAENGKDIQAEKAKASNNATKIADLEAKAKELEELKAKDMTEAEKATKALETANQRIAELEKAQTIANLKSTVAEKFKINAEQVAKVVKEDGSLDYDALGVIITEKETAAALAKEQEIANGSNNPGGGSGGSNNQTEAEKLASSLFATDNKSGEQSVLSHYC